MVNKWLTREVTFCRNGFPHWNVTEYRQMRDGGGAGRAEIFLLKGQHAIGACEAIGGQL